MSFTALRAFEMQAQDETNAPLAEDATRALNFPAVIAIKQEITRWDG